MSDGVERGVTREERIRALAAAWRAATRNVTFIPLPESETRERFYHLASAAILALRAGETDSATLQHGRDIGREMAALNLLKPETLERTLAFLGEELAGVGAPKSLTLLLAGVAGGAAAAMESKLLAQQESMKQSATLTLRQTQVKLASANRRLTEEVADRIRAERIQRDLAERLRRLHQIDVAVLSAESPEAIARISVEYLEALIPAVSIAVSLIDMHTRKLVVVWSSNPAYPPGREMPITLVEQMGRLAKGEALYIKDLQALGTSSEGVAEIAALGGRSVMALPLSLDHELIGNLAIVLGEVRPFTSEEITVTQELGDSVAVAIQNRRLLTAEQELRRRESSMREVSAALTLDLGRDEMLRLILEEMDKVVPSVTSSILLFDGGALELAAHRGVDVPANWMHDLISQRPRSLMTVLEERRPLILNDTHNSPDWVALEGFEFVRSWLGVPLMVKGDCIGLVVLDRDEINAFTQEDESLALAFTNQVAIAIDNARLFAQVQAHANVLEQRVRERTRELEVLYGITATAVSNPEMQGLLNRSLELTVEAFGCPAASVHLVEGEEAGPQLAAMLTRGSRSMGDFLAGLGPGSPLLLTSIKKGRPHVVARRGLPPELARDGVTAIVSVPLRSRGRNQGVMCLLFNRRELLAGATTELLTTIADQIGAAVENIKLYQVARQSAIIEERERLAREIHDQVTQSIYSAALFSEAALGAAEAGNDEKLGRHLLSVQEMTNQALRELRLLLFEFRTESLARKGLVEALRHRLRSVEHQVGITGEVHGPISGELPVAVEETFYRIALAGLDNALRHAHAGRVDIVIMQENGWLVMTVADDGIGFDHQAASDTGGMGLEGMQKRIDKINGEVTITSNKTGTWITARAPLPSDG